MHADRDPEAEAWLFVAGGLLATMDSRLGGLLGDDLQRVRAERRRWMARRADGLTASRARDAEKPRLRHPGLLLGQAGRRLGVSEGHGSAAQPCLRDVASGAPPARGLASGRGARCAHCTSLVPSVK